MKTRVKERLALASAISVFTNKGLQVLIPLGEPTGYDLVIDNKGLKKIEVKYTSRKGKRDNYYRVSTCVATTKNGERKIITYKNNDFDFLFVLCENNSKYLIPIKKVAGKESLYLSSLYNQYKLPW